MDVEEKIQIVKAVASEILTEDELRALFLKKEHPLAYDGFEPSGNIHIAQGLLRAITVNKLGKTGIRYVFWVADWFALMNNKLDGDLEKIRTTGEYFIEVWKASGMNPDYVTFRWASEEMDQEYWLRTIRIGMMNSVERVERCAQIMGRGEKDKLSAAQIFYPCMQANDIFHLKVDIAQLGMDQRKVNVLARESAEKLGYTKPIAIHHHMLMGLQPPTDTTLVGAEKAVAQKMSKSNPDSSIFMTDSRLDVEKKFNKAYCPEGIVENNPILEYFRYIIFERMPLVVIERLDKFGGNVSFSHYRDLETAFVNKEVHPADLKKTCAKCINELLDPVRHHFETDERAKALAMKVKSYTVTR